MDLCGQHKQLPIAQKGLEKQSPHVLFTDKNAHRRTTGKPPVPSNEVQLRLDVVDEQRHVVRQVKLGHFEDQRIAENRLAGDSVDFARSQCSDRSSWSPLEQDNSLTDIASQQTCSYYLKPKPFRVAQVLVNFN